MSKKQHNWAKEKPHHVKTGLITTRRYAESHSNKVEWVRDKKKK